MAEDPQTLKRDIEQTRRHLTDDVDALADKVSPRRIVHRRTDAARHRLLMMRHRVMGTTEHAKHAAESTAHDAVASVQDAGSRIGEAVGSAPAKAREQTRGAPLAAGMVAFAAGWVIAAALPPTARERELATKAKESAGEPVMERVGEMAQDLKENLRDPAQEAVAHVKESAAQATEEVKQESRSAADNVKEQTHESADSVRQRS
jgi:ElaB/YqjD/DUF883 family membrane-anchored ribosome-binding protein